MIYLYELEEGKEATIYRVMPILDWNDFYKCFSIFRYCKGGEKYGDKINRNKQSIGVWAT